MSIDFKEYTTKFRPDLNGKDKEFISSLNDEEREFFKKNYTKNSHLKWWSFCRGSEGGMYLKEMKEDFKRNYKVLK